MIPKEIHKPTDDLINKYLTRRYNQDKYDIMRVITLSQLQKYSKTYLDSIRQTQYKGNYLGYRKWRTEYFQKESDSYRPDISIIVDHIDYIINLIGDDHVGIGSDFDGISITPKGIEDVSKMPNITKEMVLRGYSEERIKKILGGNFMRIFSEVSQTL